MFEILSKEPTDFTQPILYSLSKVITRMKGLYFTLCIIMLNVLWVSEANVRDIDCFGSFTSETLALEPVSKPFYPIFIAITTHGANRTFRYQMRDMMRAQKNDSLFTYKFILGRPKNSQDAESFVKENLNYNDMIFFDFEDKYENLAMKTLQSRRWALSNIDFTWHVKMDDDGILFVNRLLQELEPLPRQKLWMGRTWFSLNKATNPTKYYDKVLNTDPFWKGCSKYPMYVSGGMRIMSKDVVEYLVLNNDFFQRFHNEDVTDGIWFLNTDVRPVHTKKIHWQSCGNDMFGAMDVSLAKQTTYFQRFQANESLCALKT